MIIAASCSSSISGCYKKNINLKLELKIRTVLYLSHKWKEHEIILIIMMVHTLPVWNMETEKESTLSCDMALLRFPEHYHFMTAILQALYNSNAFLWLILTQKNGFDHASCRGDMYLSCKKHKHPSLHDTVFFFFKKSIHLPNYTHNSYTTFSLMLTVFAICSIISNVIHFFRAFSTVVRQMSGYNSQRRGTAHTLPN